MDKSQRIIFNRVLLGMYLKATREVSGNQQNEMATAIGYANSTFVYMVEKGTTSIPADKLLDFAAAYAPENKHMLAAAISRLIHPDFWEICVKSILQAVGCETKEKEAEKIVDEWTKAQFKKFNISSN